MKLIAIVIAVCGLAVQGSLADVDSSALTTAFVTGGNSVPASPIEGLTTQNIREIILNETALCITQIVNDLERQIEVQSQLEVTVLQLALETFNRQVELLPVNASADHLNIYLLSLNLKIAGAFNLIPTTLGGNAVVKPKKLSSQKDKPSSDEQKPPKVHTLRELMNNLGQILEKDFSTLYKFQKKLLSAGYDAVEDEAAYSEVQEEFRTMAINEYLVPTLLSVIRDVQSKADIAQAHVTVTTWNQFLALNDQLTTVMASAGITEATEATETTETTEANEVTEAPETSESSEVNEATETPAESSEVTEATEIPAESSEVNEVTEIPAESSEVNEATEAPCESSEVNEVTEAPAESSEVNEVTEATGAPEVTEGDE